MKVKARPFHVLKKYLSIVAGVLLVVFISTTTAEANNKSFVEVFVDGEAQVVSTENTTVESLIDKLGIKLFENDLIEPALGTEITEPLFNINIYRAKSALVVDSGKRIPVQTAHLSAKDIAEDAGITINPRDILELEKSEDFLQEGHLGLKVVITRSTPFAMTLYGEEVKGFTHKNTVKQALVEAEVDIAGADSIQPALNTPLTKGLEITVSKEEIVRVVEKESIDFTEEITSDDSLGSSETVIDTTGKTGEKEVTYDLLMRDGVEISRTEISSRVIEEPVNQVSRKGVTKVSSVYIGGGTKEEWMAAAGIPQDQWWIVDFIVGRESGWNPCAYNPGQSDCNASPTSACGLAQSLPCGKQSSFGHWTDPVANLKWQYQYVTERYGGYQGAYNFWVANSWY